VVAITGGTLDSITFNRIMVASFRCFVLARALKISKQGILLSAYTTPLDWALPSFIFGMNGQGIDPGMNARHCQAVVGTRSTSYPYGSIHFLKSTARIAIS